MKKTKLLTLLLASLSTFAYADTSTSSESVGGDSLETQKPLDEHLIGAVAIEEIARLKAISNAALEQKRHKKEMKDNLIKSFKEDNNINDYSFIIETVAMKEYCKKIASTSKAETGLLDASTLGSISMGACVSTVTNLLDVNVYEEKVGFFLRVNMLDQFCDFMRDELKEEVRFSYSAIELSDIQVLHTQCLTELSNKKIILPTKK